MPPGRPRASGLGALDDPSLIEGMEHLQADLAAIAVGSPRLRVRIRDGEL